jgi:hypothetical protein
MQGSAEPLAELDEAIRKYDVEWLGRIEAEMRRPTFRRAQMGFNNNLKYKEHTFHVQTEDSGLDQPHIITHLFADGGRIIKTHKRNYHEHVARPDVAEYVRTLMKGQHVEMVVYLRGGKFDEVLAGRAIGGVELLVGPPKTPDGSKGKEAAPPAETAPPAVVAPAPEAAAPAAPVAPAPVSHFSLRVSRSLWGGPNMYEPVGERAVLGVAGEVALPGEVFCAPREAQLTFQEGRLLLEDLDGGNGVFVRVRGMVELDLGDEFVVGDQLLRVEKNPMADDGPDPDPTYFYSSPKWPSSFRVVQVFEGGAPGACVVARGNSLQIGSAIGDLVFPEDPLVSEQHCVVEEQAGTVVLTDQGSRTGVFVRVRGSRWLEQGDELLVGRTRMIVTIF